jgi:hypothetical protein
VFITAAGYEAAQPLATHHRCIARTQQQPVILRRHIAQGCVQTGERSETWVLIGDRAKTQVVVFADAVRDDRDVRRDRLEHRRDVA